MAMLTFFALIKNKNSVSNSKDLFPYNSLVLVQNLNYAIQEKHGSTRVLKCY